MGERGDRFLPGSLDQELLRGKVFQPKKEMGDYFASWGIPVPERFCFSEAVERLREEGRVLARSEHPDDYAGPSGLFLSPILKNQEVSGLNYLGWERILAGRNETAAVDFLRRLASADRHYQIYCSLSGLDREDYLKKLSFSFWRYIPGINVLMTADSARERKHHTIARLPEGNCPADYFQYEDGDISRISSVFGTSGLSLDKIPELLSVYEQIRKLPGFDPRICPIMEFQVGEDGKIYFLQYHRTRKFSQVSFTLEKEKPEEAIEASWVRGVTPPGGIKTIALIGGYTLNIGEMNFFLLAEKINNLNCGASLVVSHKNRPLGEYLTQKIRVQVMPHKPTDLLGKVADGHMTASCLFKPEASLMIPEEDFQIAIKGKTQKVVIQQVTTDYSFDIEIARLRVVSDGKRGWVEVLE
jgi:hypothetical protein